MRKILLGTTGVVGAALIGMGAAQAQQAPTVSIGGYFAGYAAVVNDDADKNVTTATGSPTATPTTTNRIGNRTTTDFRSDLEIVVNVNAKAANGLSYGAVIEVQSDGVNGTTFDTDEAYVFVSSPTLGTIRFGDEDSAANLLQVRVPTIAGMGADGDWHDSMAARQVAGTNAAPGTRRMDRTGPSLLNSINGGNDATKIVYLSPSFAGFDFGVSFAPNGGEGERAFAGVQLDRADTLTSATHRDRVTLQNEWSAALRYRGQLGPVGVAAGFGMMRAGAPDTAVGATAVQDLTAQTVGLSLTALGFTLGGEYTWGKYDGETVGRAAIANGREESSHWVIGGTYVTGAISVGAFYGVAKQDNGTTGSGASLATLPDREQTVWGIGAAYALAPGLDLLASYYNLKDDNGPSSARNLVGVTPTTQNTGTATSRSADVFFMGARLAF